VGEFYTPSAESGLRYSDPRLAIEWPLPASEISDKDRAWPLLEVSEPAIRERMTLARAAVAG
jgi:dTDP-4-dehydrorhamnose 3,5-epimerase